jgi:hypothetical protein
MVEKQSMREYEGVLKVDKNKIYKMGELKCIKNGLK